jgi:hypothetical protein
MKHPPFRQDNNRFSGSLRHYHRAGSQNQRTWDEWIDGKVKAPSKPWLKIVLITLSVLALAGIIIGLIVELR